MGFTTAASLVHELMEARDERRLLNLQRQLSRLHLLIIDELGFVPLSRTGANCSSRCSASATSGAPSWSPPTCPSTSGPRSSARERLTGALLDRLTHHVHILEVNGDSYRLKRSRENTASKSPDYSDHV